MGLLEALGLKKRPPPKEEVPKTLEQLEREEVEDLPPGKPSDPEYSAWHSYKKILKEEARKDWIRWKEGKLDYADFLTEQFGEQGELSRKNPAIAKIRHERLWKNQDQFVDYILGDSTPYYGAPRSWENSIAQGNQPIHRALREFSGQGGEPPIAHEPMKYKQWQFEDARMFRYRERATHRAEISEPEEPSQAKKLIHQALEKALELQQVREELPKIAATTGLSLEEVQAIFDQEQLTYQFEKL